VASVQIQTVVLALAADLTQSIELDVAQIDDSRSRPGEIRAYANGRRRAILRSGQDRKIPLKADWVSRADRETLEQWAGQLLLVRDSLGRKLWCTYLDMTSSSNPLQDEATITLQLQEITHDEAV
jgi:hypothetical protein